MGERAWPSGRSGRALNAPAAPVLALPSRRARLAVRLTPAPPYTVVVWPRGIFGGSQPVPSTFTGRRALDFVLKDTGLMDKTLLFDIEILDTSKGAPRRGPGEFVGVAKEQITRDNAVRGARV